MNVSFHNQLLIILVKSKKTILSTGVSDFDAGKDEKLVSASRLTRIISIGIYHFDFIQLSTCRRKVARQHERNTQEQNQVSQKTAEMSSCGCKNLFQLNCTIFRSR